MTWMLLWLTGRVGGSVWANTLQKRLLLAGLGPARLWWVTYSVLALPGVLLVAFTWREARADFWLSAVTAALLDVAGNLAMVAALRTTDLSVFGPLNAFRPAMALGLGWIFLGELPTLGGAAGVTVTTLGAFLLLAKLPSQTHPDISRAAINTFACRMLGLGLSTAGATFLKRATLAGSAGLTLGVWGLTGWLGLLVAIPLAGGLALRSGTASSPAIRRQLAQHAAAFFVMQWLTLKIFERTLLAYSFAFFQLAMVLQVFLGHRLFGEPDFARRLLCCLVMSGGALLVVLAG